MGRECSKPHAPWVVWRLQLNLADLSFALHLMEVSAAPASGNQFANIVAPGILEMGIEASLLSLTLSK